MKKLLPLLGVFGTNWAFATSAPHATQSVEKSQQALDALLVSPEYSYSTTTKQWVSNHPAKDSPADLSWLQQLFDFLNQLGELSQPLGVLGKVIAIAFLMVMVLLLIKYKALWLPWLSRWSLPKKTAQATVYQDGQTLSQVWHNLPAKETLVNHLMLKLQQGQWLEVLAMLYQATLREFDITHQLPIDKHQTEDECMWLLSQAKHQHPNEQVFFDTLVALWRACAYGQRLPDGVAVGDYSLLTKLIHTWGVIYLPKGRHD